MKVSCEDIACSSIFRCCFKRNPPTSSLNLFRSGESSSMSVPRSLFLALTLTLVVSLAAAQEAGHASAAASKAPAPVRKAASSPSGAQDITVIKHIVFIIKENRSFDNYFGTYPGANGATSG